MRARVWRLVPALCLLAVLLWPAPGTVPAQAAQSRRAVILIPGLVMDCTAQAASRSMPAIPNVPSIPGVPGVLAPPPVPVAPAGLNITGVPGIEATELAALCDNGDPAGYNAEARASEVFAAIREQVTRREGGQIEWHAYSYATAWQSTPVYSGGETRQSLEVSARLLGEQIRAWGTQDVAYTIVSHSIGGAVAAYWAGTETDPATLVAVRAIVTLDSPVRGFTPTELGYWSGETGGQAGHDLQNPEVAATMQRAVERVSTFTLGNTADVIVPANISILDGGCRPEPCLLTLSGPGKTNHFEILSAEPAIGLIDRLVRGDAIS